MSPAKPHAPNTTAALSKTRNSKTDATQHMDGPCALKVKVVVFLSRWPYKKAASAGLHTSSIIGMMRSSMLENF
jgi:hypothetical protein